MNGRIEKGIEFACKRVIKTLPRAEFAQTADSGCFALKLMGQLMKVVDRTHTQDDRPKESWTYLHLFYTASQ